MSVISLILTIALVGFLLWLINTYLPMEGTVKRILNGVVVVLLVLWLLQGFGVLGSIGGLRVG